mgnify:FL=1
MERGTIMTKNFIRILTATTALSTAYPAFAQDAQPDDGANSEEIIVTARRADERLQDVPVSVQVVTGASLDKLAITSVDEVSKLAPGLSLTNQGDSTAVVLRGVTWQPGSGTPATPIYFNEAPFDPAQTVQSLFDVGQIEVLRGPQGTSRGAPSISGAVTISTRKPDLDEFGGYVRAQYGSANHWAVQGAVNAPIIKDVLAIRLAANIENSRGNRVFSVNSTIKPTFEDRSLRATVLLTPTDTLSVQAMYQRRKTARRDYQQVVGSGSPGLAALGIPANFNGPALTLDDRASVQDAPTRANEHVDLLTVNASWEVFNQKLTYNFGRQFFRGGPSFNATDPLNILPGFESGNRVDNRGLPRFSTNEIRLSSTPESGLPFEYDIGWFSKNSGGIIDFTIPTYLPGAFGAPFASIPGQVRSARPAYVLNADFAFGLGQSFDSFYGNARVHLGEKTELSGGIAFVRDKVPVRTDLVLSSAIIALPTFLPPPSGCQGISQFLPVSIDYGPAYCQSTIPASVAAPEVFNSRYKDTLYNFSLSHKFTDDLMVYAATGSSFRTGLPALNNAGLPNNLLLPQPETAKSYEVGVKASFGRALRINAAVFQLDYQDQLTRFEGVQFLSAIPGAGVKTTGVAFYRNINSRVRGFELEVAANPMDNLSLGGSLSYSKIKSKGGDVPCNNPAVPLTAANPINFCPSVKGEVLNTTAPFQASLNGSYDVPVSSSLDGYFRFNLNYQGRNPNYGNFRTGAAFKSTPAYAVVDLFAGLTGNEGGWDLGVYAKNVFDKQAELARIFTPNSVYPLFAAPSGYDVVRTSLPREIGVALRFAFGSR